MQLSDSCRKQLEEAETRVEMLIRKEGTYQPEPFRPRSDVSRGIPGRTSRSWSTPRSTASPRPKPRSRNHPQAMRYSLFAGGKRIRPCSVSQAAAAVSQTTLPALMNAACALEMIHTYSLIHDDLPALDNDDFRRGKPTCHKVFGEAMAILAGDALSRSPCRRSRGSKVWTPRAKSRLIEELSFASGTVEGMIGGQVTDIEGERQPPTAELLDSIHRAKTGALLRASVRMGGICARRRRGAVRRPFDLRRARRSRLSDRGRHSRCRGIVRSAGQNRRQRRRAGQDHFPGGLWPRRLARHGRARMRTGPRALSRLSANARSGCTKSPT